MRIVETGSNIMFTPPATAHSHSPRDSATQAWCTATNEDEQAVSIVRAAPRQSNTYDSRAASMVMLTPVEVAAVIRSRFAALS